MRKRKISGFLFVFFLLAACNGRVGEEPFAPTPQEIDAPAHFSRMEMPAGNPLTAEGVELGRRLFYDPILSIDSSLSCAGCHIPELAFTDGRAVSTGVAGRTGRRSAPSLLNVGYYTDGLFWDGRVTSLEAQALHPVRDSVEMACDWETVEERLRSHEHYPELFRRAFGIKSKKEIDRGLTARALAQFQRSLVSFDAKYDRVQRGEAEFTSSEKRGWTIFFDASPEVPASECNHCHVDPLFTSRAFFNNGLDSPADLTGFSDRGLGEVTGRYYDNGKFLAPTLRNIELTAPYMHDGRFSTLEAVIEHYNSGGHFGPNVSPNIRPLHLNESDKRDLIAFLKTLTDTTVLHNLAFRPPVQQ